MARKARRPPRLSAASATPRMRAQGKMPCSTLHYSPEQQRERVSEEKFREERSNREEKAMGKRKKVRKERFTEERSNGGHA
jgi:hypothetical protein